MTTADEWIPFDYENKTANPTPPPGEMVWVYDEFYSGVTIGEYDRRGGWWEIPGYKDDCSVTHWRPMVKPEPPRGLPDS